MGSRPSFSSATCLPARPPPTTPPLRAPEAAPRQPLLLSRARMGSASRCRCAQSLFHARFCETGAAGVRVLSGALLGGTLDYSVAPIGLWLRTERAIYRCLEAAPSYAPRCRPPGGSPSVPLPEASAIGLLHLFEHTGGGLEQPFQSKKRAAFPILRLRAYEVVASAVPQSAGPNDVEVTRLMVALSAKARHTATAPWNLARWVMAVQRCAAAAPSYFTPHGGSMVSLGVGAPPAGSSAPPVASTTPAEPAATPAPTIQGAVASGGPGMATARSGDADARTKALEADLFGDIDDL
ncbi:hypothetical protein EMIHUDRAFT_247104 [Emiliania huxleyi CCMP1516]|uniref:Uncharacterized protein n=2 Tax=Emiliania huxleyi TaxID=2903 RepID=A0A0D3IPN8_EMIH1|nr:hypothetical protein EMIHUDRAFT_247104 [Emiliania huxleyi CCMP1516]EOD13223.1 hypothetical protein EMIHUDRAFT_247104 [Emiliania huxleyi CCMP1516]|eukprot:XP_005765652.1 hypothetical protein EMIHUDRAFT_247104 [Emiliania huxleyi CCMP1516]